MTRRLSAVAAVLALAWALAWRARADDAPAAAPAPEGIAHLTIVHTNDLHAHLEHFAAIARIAADERARNPATLFLDAGDCITGTTVSTVFQGTPIFEVMNLMAYDLGTIGNHEFDHGWQKVREYVEVARQEIVCANATDPDGKPFGDAPWRVLDCGGVRVGVIGLLTGDLAGMTTTKATAGVTVEKPLDAARRLVPEVREKADLVVLLTHCGVEVDAAIAGAVPGIDLIVGGHSHTKLAKALTIQPNGTRVVQAWCYGKAVGVVEVGWDRGAKRVVSFDSRLVPVEGNDLPEDPAVKKAVDGWLAKVRDMDEVIGHTDAPLSRAALRPILERIYRDALGADLGYQNARGIRDEVRAGDVRVSDLFSVLPFENTLVKVTVPGSRLSDAQQKALGKAFDPAKSYVIATNSFVGDHRDRYLRAKGAPVEDSKLGMRETVIAWVRKHGGFVPKGERAPAPGSSDDP